MHFHNKPFDVLKKHAKQKLTGRVADFSEASLTQYKDTGSHLVKYFFMTEEEYLNSFPKKTVKYIPAFRAKLSELGTSIHPSKGGDAP